MNIDVNNLKNNPNFFFCKLNGCILSYNACAKRYEKAQTYREDHTFIPIDLFLERCNVCEQRKEIVE